MSTIIRALRPDDRPYLLEALRSDRTFTDEEVRVALELIDNALDHGEDDYAVRVADLETINRQLVTERDARAIESDTAKRRVTELEDELSAARESLRRVIKAQNRAP